MNPGDLIKQRHDGSIGMVIEIRQYTGSESVVHFLNDSYCLGRNYWHPALEVMNENR